MKFPPPFEKRGKHLYAVARAFPGSTDFETRTTRFTKKQKPVDACLTATDDGVFYNCDYFLLSGGRDGLNKAVCFGGTVDPAAVKVLDVLEYPVQIDLKAPGDFADALDGRVFLAPLHLPDVGGMKAAFFGQFLLAHFIFRPVAPYPLADFDSKLRNFLHLSLFSYIILYGFFGKNDRYY